MKGFYFFIYATIYTYFLYNMDGFYIYILMPFPSIRLAFFSAGSRFIWYKSSISSSSYGTQQESLYMAFSICTWIIDARSRSIRSGIYIESWMVFIYKAFYMKKHIEITLCWLCNMQFSIFFYLFKWLQQSAVGFIAILNVAPSIESRNINAKLNWKKHSCI